MKKLLTALMLSILLLTGCSSVLDKLIVSKKQKELELEALRQKHTTELRVKVEESEKAKDKVIESKDKQIVAGSNAFYAADLTFKTIATPVRTDLIINNYVNEGWTALGKRVPDAEMMIKINERLKTELDEKNTSLAALKAKHDEKLIENQKLHDETLLWQQKLEKLEKEKTAIIVRQKEEIEAKQTKIIEQTTKIAELERERREAAEDMKATKTKFSMIVGSIALACLAGAIWSPVFKREFGIGAAVLGFIAVGILYIQAWHVALAGGVVILGLVGWAAYKHFKEQDAATDVYRAIESFKNKAKEQYDTLLKPELTEWMTKYTKGGKKIVNTRAVNHVDERLREVGDK